MSLFPDSISVENVVPTDKSLEKRTTMVALIENKPMEVLLIEDNLKFSAKVTRWINTLNQDPQIAAPILFSHSETLTKGLQHLEEFLIDIVLLDISLPDSHGLESVARIQSRFPNTAIIVLSKDPTWSSILKAANSGARDCLAKGSLSAESLYQSLYYAFERKKVEDRLEEAQARHNSLVEQLPIGVYCKDLTGSYTFVNNAFCKMLDLERSEISSAKDHKLFTTSCAKFLTEGDEFVLKSLSQKEWDHKIETIRGDTLNAHLIKLPIFDADDEIIGTQGLVIDANERHSREEQRLLGERFSAVETLAGQVAHHMNNRLAPVLLDVAKITSIATEPAVLEACARISKAAMSSANALRHLLVMAQKRQTDGQFLPVELDLVTSDLKRFILSAFPKNVECEIHIESGLHKVAGDFAALKELLEMLSINACEAMQSKGTLTIRVENVSGVTLCSSGEDPSCVSFAVRMSVIDTGPGVSAAMSDRVFDPYFTTKNPEEHPGMGLTKCLKTVRGHRGTIAVNKDYKQGCCIEVTLPASIDSVNENVGTLTLSPSHGSDRLILLVDDDEAVLASTGNFLRECGFRVIDARDGVEGFKEFSKLGQEIDLVLTDLTMPHMDGARLIEAIRATSSTVPIFVSTGVEFSSDMSDLDGLHVSELIHKPFDPRTLLNKLCNTLDRQDRLVTDHERKSHQAEPLNPSNDLSRMERIEPAPIATTEATF